MTAAPLISVVSPVYGCTDCLEQLYAAVRDAFAGSGLDWELVLVDDRGPDDPWPVIAALAGRDPRVRGVQLTRNHGQHLAIWAGLEAARGDWVGIVDCDLQDDPAALRALHGEAVARGVDAVVVSRGRWSDSALRRLASRAFHRVVTFLSGLDLEGNTGNFGLYSREMVDVLLSFEDREVFLPAMVALTGLPRVLYELDRSQRAAGNSSYDFVKLMGVAISVIVRFSDRPLKLSVYVGLLFSTVSAIVSLVLFLAWWFGSFTVAGWTSTILSIWFLTGIVLAVLGIHGIYLGRVFAEVRRRPRILVRRTTFGDARGSPAAGIPAADREPAHSQNRS